MRVSPAFLSALFACTPAPVTDPAADSSGSLDTADSGEPGDTSEHTGDSTDTHTDPVDVTGLRGVILFIGDGMGPEHVAAGGMYANGASGSLTMETLPNRGRARTASLSGTTDSAASATALATGHKTWNDVVGQNRDGAVVENLLERARALGLATGIVTTDRLTGATPSSFVAHAPNRGDVIGIVLDYNTSLPDVTLGGGFDEFESSLAALPAQVVTTRTALLAAVPDGRSLFGVFANTQFLFVSEGYDAETPTLAEMTERALAWLDDDPEGFFLMVEGARIDHGSHGRDAGQALPEVIALDAAVAAANGWADAAAHEVTLIVTADHECGGLTLTGAAPAGTLPPTTWRWGQHTNADVPVYARGALTEVLADQRLDQIWVHATLAAAVDGARSVTPPEVPALIDGTTSEVSEIVVTQTWASSFGPGYNQLDALRLGADVDGLRVGVDGVFQREDNAVLVLVDLDYGAGTGFGQELVLSDLDDGLDAAISNTEVFIDVPGVGFDVVLGAVGAEETIFGEPGETGGLRGFANGSGAADNFAWLQAISAFDDGNVSVGGPAPDAGATGLTENGFEGLIPWGELGPPALEGGGTTIAVAVVLVNYGGDWASNQALPPLAEETEPGAGAIVLSRVVTLEVDGLGFPVGAAAVVP
ncbi:MAG: alkaline phosphatase [Myxococcales bacterium]|nr:alkaline phosphatase [Myxococcales bacterium]